MDKKNTVEKNCGETDPMCQIQKQALHFQETGVSILFVTKSRDRLVI